MESQGGTLSFGTAFDTSDFEQGAQRIENSVAEVVDNVSSQSSRIAEYLNSIPQVNIDIVMDASQSLATIDAAFQEIDTVVDTNGAAIKELEAEYNRLGSEIRKMSQKAATPQLKAEYEQFKKQRQAIKENIALRKSIIDEAGKTADKLLQTEQRLKKEAEAAAQNADAHVSMRSRIRELTLTLVELEAAGQRGTQQYQEVQAEVARLTDAWGDAQEQAKILANDQAGFQGVVSGLSGIMGGAQAASSAISLFTDENEDLQKAMLKVQQLMSITMGLQQMSVALNKDSAFQLVIINGLKEWWNKLLAVGRGEQIADTAATAAHAATATADAAAVTAETTAKEAAAAATGAKAGAEVADTAAMGANAAGAGVATAANITLAGAFRMVAAAIKSIPVIGWILAGVSALIGLISWLSSESEEAAENTEKLNEAQQAGAKAYIQAKTQVDDYIAKLNRFNGTAKEEKKLVKEVNDKFGEHLGYAKSAAQAKEILTSKGSDYCNALALEAKAQALLNQVTEAYIETLKVEQAIKNGDYKHWYNTAAGDKKDEEAARQKAKKEYDYWLSEYNKVRDQAAEYRSQHQIGGFEDPTAVKVKGGGGSNSNAFDAKKAAREQQNAIDTWKKSVQSFFKNANNELTDSVINSMQDGLTKELNSIHKQTFQKQQAWKAELRDLARVRMQAEKDLYMSQKGATENGWYDTEKGKMSESDWEKRILEESKAQLDAEKKAFMSQEGATEEMWNERLEKSSNIYHNYYRVLAQITKQGEDAMNNARQKYTDTLIQQYGTTLQKEELLTRQWAQRIAFIPQEYLNEALNQMEADFSKLRTEGFKDSVNWDSVFGDLGEQSIQSIGYNLEKIKTYFESAKSSMSVEEIKDFQEAISKMEDEIASRNPFAALTKSMKDIKTAKDEFVAATTEMTAAQQAQTAAQNEYNEAKLALEELQAQVDAGTLTANSEKYAEAQERLSSATFNVAQATDRTNKAEQRLLTSRNNITKSYKNFSNQLRAVGGVVSSVGNDAKNLASVFKSTVANGIGKAVDTLDTLLNAASTVIDAIGDTGKSVTETMVTTAQSSGQAMQSTAAATATAISTVEKASVILAVIGAALQVATAIASLFNDDESKQKEIENLQERIDQLQWELDNQDTVRLQNKVGNAVEKLREIYAQTRAEVYALHFASQSYGDFWSYYLARINAETEAYNKTVEKLADAYAKVDYTANKALGEEKFKSSRNTLENLAEQQLAIQKQINAERDKKDTDDGKIKEWERNIQEIANEMAEVINTMLEDIIGSSAEDIAQTLGDAFFEAAAAGEDAMEAWRDKAKEIVRDVLKRMLVTKFLEEPLGQIFDKYKQKWFDSKGQFNGIDAIINSMGEFEKDIDSVGDSFNQIWQNLPDNITKYFTDEAERNGESKGIATASQESVDENNARLTTIQGHTYTLVQGLAELNVTSNAMLVRLTNIDENTQGTNERLDSMSSRLKTIGDTVDDIQTRGIKIKS